MLVVILLFFGSNLIVPVSYNDEIITGSYMDVIVNITGNIISGPIMGETASLLSERFGKIMQDRQSISVYRADSSFSHSKQLESAIPVSKITTQSWGEFAGLFGNNPNEKINLKMVHDQIVIDAAKLNGEMNR